MKIKRRLLIAFSDICFILISIVFSSSVQLNWFSSNPYPIIGNFTIGLCLIFGALLSMLIFFFTRRSIRILVKRSSLPEAVKKRYPFLDIFTYSVFILPVIGSVGILFTPTFGVLVLLGFAASQFLLIFLLIPASEKKALFASTSWLSFLFLISGFAAIIYQIVWQKTLFAEFGLNIESTTTIVSTFMFGLGIGSLVGGFLSKRFPDRLPQFFLVFEIVIGIFGTISIELIQIVSSAQILNSLILSFIAIFGLLLIPTVMMGATLPVLVSYLYDHYKNVGKSVGLLYFINTIGSAIACFFTADIFFSFFGKQTSVIIAAFCNFGTGFLIYRYIKSRKLDNQPIPSRTTAKAHSLSYEHISKNTYRFFFILLMSCIVGYISLSQEILWFRAVSYATGGSPDVFAYVLGFFLSGLAFGSLLAKKICERFEDIALTFIAAMLLIAPIIYYLTIPMTAHIMLTSRSLAIYFNYVSVTTITFLMGGVFPVLCHFGIRSRYSIGLPMSWVYFANIIGATAGPLVTGFLLLDVLPLDLNVLFISVFTLIVSGVVWTVAKIPFRLRVSGIGVLSIILVSIVSMHQGTYYHILEKLHLRNPSKEYKYVIQNRSGIIAVEEANTDIIYGGGVYDGRFNIDLVVNSNEISRSYIIPALHPNPSEVLEIGLSGGSWARVIASYPGTKKLTIVEINPGYLDLIKKYPEVSSLLTDPKVKIYIDDGRRWLLRNPQAKFDVIVMNTTFYWRNGATNLLSQEFLDLCKQHLKKGGVVYYNTTLSEDIPFTAAKVFTYVTQYSSFVAGSDNPFSISYEEKRNNLLRFTTSSNDLTRNYTLFTRSLEALAWADLSDKSDQIRRKQGLWLITDDNMATEFKSRHRLYDAKAAWHNLL